VSLTERVRTFLLPRSRSLVVRFWCWERIASVQRGPHAFAGLALAVLLLAACAPQQQLILPDPLITGSASELSAKTRNRQGVRMSDPADPDTRSPSLMEGTGELVGSPNPRPPAQTATPGNSVSINLVAASVSAAAKAVLGDTLRYNYTISDKVTGTVTLQTPQPVTRAALLELFENALQAQGAAIVATNGVYRILPLEEAMAAGARINPRGATSRDPAGLMTEVVQLKYVSATDMERLLRSVGPQSSAIRIDQHRNLVILTGSRSDLAALADAVSVFDVDWMRGMSFAIIPIESADPEAIAQEVDVIFANDGAGKGIVRFIPNRRLKSILAISARTEHLRRAEQWIRKLDMVGRESEKQVHVYHVQNRGATELAALLQRVYGSQDSARRQTSPSPTQSQQPASDLQGGIAITQPLPAAITNGGAAAAPRAVAAQPVVPGFPALPPSPIAPPTQPGFETSPTVSADPASAAARQPVDAHRPVDDRQSGIAVVPDETNNSLVITATASEYRRIRQILARIDVAPSQVLLEATIAEITLNDELKLGMRWFFESRKSNFSFTDSAVGAISPVFPGFSYFLNKVDIKVVLNTLATITNVNVVSSPSLMVIDNKRALLQVGDEVPVATQSAVAVLTPGAPIVNSVTFRNTGIILGITPRIGDRGRVLLDIEQEASDVVRTTTSNIDSPTIQQRRIRTMVAVADGESVVLAGLIQDKATRERGQIPILGDTPLIGNLFKNKTDTIRRTELLIAITPRIVNDNNHMRAIVDEYRGKLNFNTRPQRHGLPDRREQLDRIQR